MRGVPQPHEISRGREDLGPGSRSASREGAHEVFIEGYEVCGMKFSGICSSSYFSGEMEKHHRGARLTEGRACHAEAFSVGGLDTNCSR